MSIGMSARAENSGSTRFRVKVKGGLRRKVFTNYSELESPKLPRRTFFVDKP
jgi:hypothetical protein